MDLLRNIVTTDKIHSGINQPRRINIIPNVVVVMLVITVVITGITHPDIAEVQLTEEIIIALLLDNQTATALAATVIISSDS